jgi:hypothetical protein
MPTRSPVVPSLALTTSLLLAASVLLAPFPLRAWEKHASLMPWILSDAAGPGIAQIPDTIANRLDQPIQTPCPEDDARVYARLATELKLNPKATLEPTDARACARHETITGRAVIARFVDEPDQGMDQDLPWPKAEVDPEDAARWMGGTTGPTSTGSRHMYFGGWQLWHPLETFQIPTHAVGYARERAALMARKARELLAQGGAETAWGYRVLAWEAHYLQDLSQPFHAVQLPSLGMVPWYAMLKWPPSAGFADLVHETTRTIANYHWAFEHFAYYRLTARLGGQGAGQERRSPYIDCLEKPDAPPGDAGLIGETRAVLLEDPHRAELASDPALLADRVARASVRIGGQAGAATLKFFTSALKDRSVDLPAGRGVPDYATMAVRPDLVDARAELMRVTCRALGDASVATRIAIQAALKP